MYQICCHTIIYNKLQRNLQYFITAARNGSIINIQIGTEKYLQEIIQKKLERLESYRKYWAIRTTCEACASVLHVQICMLAVFLRLPSLIHPIVVI